MAEELETAQIPPHIMAAMRERMKMAQRMSRIKHKIVVMSGKGGVGKSSVAANLACVLAENASVGLVDADVTGPDIPMLMGVQDAQVKATDTGMEPTVGPAGVKVISMAQLIDRDTAVVWRGPLKIKALKQMLSDVEWGDLDYLVIDLPPGTSDEPLSVAQEIPDADGAVVVTTPQQVSLLDVRKSIAFAKAVKMDILGVIENMSGFVCPHCGKQTDIFKAGGGEDAAKELGLPFLGRVPLDPRIVIGGDTGKPFVLEHPDSRPRAMDRVPPSSRPPRDERLDLGSWDRADDAVDRLAVFEEEHRRDRRDSESLRGPRVFIDVQLSETEGRRVGARDLLEDRGDPVAGTAPFGPEIDEDETRFLDLRIERPVHELNRSGPGDGHGLGRRGGHELPQLSGPDRGELWIVHGGEHLGSTIKGFVAA